MHTHAIPLRVRAWIVPGLLAIGSIYLGFRVFELEERVQKMSARLDASERENAGAKPTDATAAAAQDVAAAPVTSARLAAIEDDLAQVQEDYAGLDEQLTEALPKQGAGDEARILDVVTRAQTRIRDRQIEFHQAHWRKARADLLDMFAAGQKLERWQTDGLKDLLDEETDSMIDIMVRPDLAENPDKAAADWQQRLEETDAEAVRLLEPKQREAWLGARAYERTVLWPWLPQHPTPGH